MSFTTCPIGPCTSPGPGPSGICAGHAPLLALPFEAQLRFGIAHLLFATPADAALVLGQPFAVVDAALVRLWKSHDPLGRGAGLILSRSRQHLMPPVQGTGGDLCCTRCGTLVIPAGEDTPALYFLGREGEDDWVWSSRPPICKPFVDGTLHAFTWTVAEREDRPGNRWTGRCARCGLSATTTDDPHGGPAPRFTYRHGAGLAPLPNPPLTCIPGAP